MFAGVRRTAPPEAPNALGRVFLLMGTADANTGVALDYFRVVAGQYVPVTEAIIIPEPATLGLVAIGGALMLRRRRRSA